MASDLFNLSNLSVTDVDGTGPGAGSTKNTGDLRRKYNFGDRVSELAIAQDPFFRFVSMVSKKPTDDPEFKFTEKRPSYHKRYAYVIAVKKNDGSFDVVGDRGAVLAEGGAASFRMATDYKNQGNLQNVYGQDTIKVGADGTMPKFYLQDQVIKVPIAASANGAPTGYLVCKVNTATEHPSAGTKNDASGTTNNPEMVQLDCTVIKIQGAAADSQYLTTVANLDSGAYKPGEQGIAGTLEPQRSYVMGSAHAEGTGYPETWKDQPYSTNYGLTQIWKTSMAMTNTARATSLKYESSEWARVWKEKLIEHKWDIENSLLFGSQTSVSNVNYTQGAVDYILNYGNSFSLNTSTKTSDDFLDDMSNYMDPRYGASNATVFFCSTAVYNWLHKLGGYFKNNLEVSPNFRSDLAITGKKKVFGVDITTISTPYGDMNVARNIHLDGTNISMLGVGMKYCNWRPLAGNGVNRDTSIYVGVQTLENSGVDRRVDLILTEGGMEWQMPECHAVWKNA